MFCPDPLRFDRTKMKAQEPLPEAPTSPVRAPRRGVYINGLRYRPGEEIPEDRLERLPEEDRSKLEAEALPDEDFERVNNRLSESSGMPSVHTPGLTSKQKAKARRATLQIGGAYESPGQQPVEDPEGRRKGLPKHAATASKRASEEVRRLLPELNLPPEIAQHLTKDEEAELSWKGAREVVKLFNQLPSEQELAAMARAGEAARGWYEKAAPALRMVFGEDTDKFVALLAATSPRVPVQENFKKALIIWDKFKEVEQRRAQEGKPPMSKDEVRKWLVTMRPVVPEEHAARHEKDAKRGKAKRGDLKVSGGAYPYLTPAEEHAEDYRAGEGQIDFFAMHDKAIAAALTASDPGNEDFGVLGEGGAYKIDSFRRNLLGNLWAITNDVWQSLAMGVDQGVFGKAHGYMAANAKIRRTAQMMNANLGPKEKKWSPAEVQETIWSFCRSLAMLNGRSRMPKHKGPGKRFPEDQAGLAPMEALQQLTRGDVADTVNFLSLMLGNSKDAKNVRTRLARLGYGEALAKVRRLYAGQGGPANADAPAAAPADFPLLERAAREAARVEGNAKRLTFQRRLRFAAGQPVATQMAASAAAPAAMPPAAGLSPLQPSQPNPQDEHKEHLLAFSPNVDDLSFEEALARVRSGNHKAFKKIVQHVNEQIGLKTQLSDAIGDWSDGAENSLLQQIKEPVDQKTVDYLAAWYGLLSNQKAVLAFTPSHTGLDSVYQIEVPSTDLGQIRKSLDAAGIPFRTLVPSGKGTKLVIFDQNRELRGAAAKWAGRLNAPIRESIGSGRFIGGNSRTDARAKYRKIITAYEAAAAGSRGQVRTYQPPHFPNHLRAAEQGTPGGQAPQAKLRRLGRRLRFSALGSHLPEEHLPEGVVSHRAVHANLAKYNEHIRRVLRQIAREHRYDRPVLGLVHQIMRGHVELMPVLGDRLEELGDDRADGPWGVSVTGGGFTWAGIADGILGHATEELEDDEGLGRLPQHIGDYGREDNPYLQRALSKAPRIPDPLVGATADAISKPGRTPEGEARSQAARQRKAERQQLSRSGIPLQLARLGQAPGPREYPAVMAAPRSISIQLKATRPGLVRVLKRIARDYRHDRTALGLVKAILSGHVERLPILGDYLEEQGDPRAESPYGSDPTASPHDLASPLSSWAGIAEGLLRGATRLLASRPSPPTRPTEPFTHLHAALNRSDLPRADWVEARPGAPAAPNAPRTPAGEARSREARERRRAAQQGQESSEQLSRSGRPLRLAKPPLGQRHRVPTPPPVSRSYGSEYHRLMGYSEPIDFPAYDPGIVRRGILAGGSTKRPFGAMKRTLRHVYSGFRGRSDETARQVRALVRAVWRGDLDAIAPLRDRLEEAGEEELALAVGNGPSPQRMMQAALTETEFHRATRDEEHGKTHAQDYKILGELRDGPPAPTIGERVREIGRAARRLVSRPQPKPAMRPDEPEAQEQPQQFARGEGRREDGSIVGKLGDVASRVGAALLAHVHKDSLTPRARKRRRLKGWQGTATWQDMSPEERGQVESHLKYARGGVQAPAGGVVVRGLYYPGGKWIPSANLEKASYDQYQHVEAQRARRERYRREDGSISVEPALASAGANPRTTEL